GDPGALALLQLTLQRLWEERDGDLITHDAYDRVGGGRLAVARWAEKVYAGLSPEEQADAQALLLRLIRPAPGAGVSCERLPVEKLVPAGGEAMGPLTVLKRLVDAGLVMRLEPVGDGLAEFAVIHEALATAWDRFLVWLEKERERHQFRLRLQSAA